LQTAERLCEHNIHTPTQNNPIKKTKKQTYFTLVILINTHTHISL